MEKGSSIQIERLVEEFRNLNSSKGGKEMCKQEGEYNLENSKFCDSALDV